MLRVLAQIVDEETADRDDTLVQCLHVFNRLARHTRTISLAVECGCHFRMHDHAYLIKDVIVDEADQTAFISPFVALQDIVFS